MYPRAFHVFWFLCSASLFVNGQREEKVLHLDGVVLDSSTQTAVAFVVLELIDSQVVLSSGVSDLDGRFSFCLCSRPFGSNSAVLRAKFLGYTKKIVLLPVTADTTIRISISRNDMAVAYDKESIHAYLQEQHPFLCGTEWYERMKEDNPRFQHCDGTVKTFKEIQGSDVQWCAWQELRP